MEGFASSPNNNLPFKAGANISSCFHSPSCVRENLQLPECLWVLQTLSPVSSWHRIAFKTTQENFKGLTSAAVCMVELSASDSSVMLLQRLQNNVP